MNVIYRSETRLCVEKDGIVVHVEKNDGYAEARASGTGGPRSGEVVGRIQNGCWTVDPISDAVSTLVLRALSEI